MKSARTVISDRLSLYSAGPGFAGSGVRPLRKKFDPNEPIAATENDSNCILPCEPLHVEDGHLIDASGRKRVLKGINVDSAMKLPTKPNMPSYEGDSSDPDNVFFDGDNVTFVGRPFPLEEAELHWNRIKTWGYNTIRYLVTWEAIEHAGPGKYDNEFVTYTIEMLKIIHKVGGLYVFMECHQDVWSRYSGGSGAPLWTFYAAGLNPANFHATEAAILQNHPRFDRAHDQECYPKMLWTTNYKRLASLTMFTLFFAGQTYFPHLKINGVNIQQYLQKHHLRALGHLWYNVIHALPDMVKDGTLLGFESLNEPNCGLVGHAHMGYHPSNQHLRLDTTPTVYQCFRLGMGLPAEIDVYKITVSGPQKDGSRMVDPKGKRAWLLPEEAQKLDAHYGWRRSGWKVGECIYAGLKIWKWNKFADWDKINTMPLDKRIEFSYSECQLRVPNYFNQVSPRISFNVDDERLPSQIDMHFFINHFFVEYYKRLKKMIRSISPDVFMLIQPPVLEPPPKLINDEHKLIDEKTIYCPHYYDGLSLLMKTWNDKYNVDTLGIMRGRYLNPVLGLVVGERAIRNCIKKQFCEIANEARENLGNIPVLMSETGMPFDMDGKRAYEDGRYTSQTAALDALANALEGSRMHHTYWCYTSVNCHKWGDRWNNEDFSFWSPEDRDLAFDDEDDVDTSSPSRRNSVTPSLRAIRALKETAGNSSVIKTRLNYHKKRLMPNMFKKQFCSDEDLLDDDYEPSMDNSTLISVSSDNLRYKHMKNCYPSPDGLRAPSAILRPFLISSMGVVKDTEFDIKSSRFALTLTIKEQLEEDTLEKCPTVIFVPKWHYPFLNYNDIYLTSGHVKYNEKLEYLEWYHFDTDDTANGSSTSSSAARAASDDETIIIKNNSGKYEDISQKDENLFGDVCTIV
ncbi:hypothetical protein FT663_03952 [Candidozyma haemuli var. vulneris]|uniref:Glycoside hydrolase family 5 C-terminal domain-containing protein n=1 Tax=Candidozyma haemuli TaxID=45357 RepID=A0A2V1AZU6_9ASCO|nr:hypothetical protein CXQ85_003116 [[Candida] haemuloni]KAF3988494.1 hypothetical protein FT662_03363 [[Candida] haemuloni var. vulneris]KAF3988656.1 hypothetical protein FT663_03952 [[Candida] haemuloni var. vulneris]PVH23382.1 hypothetical protein CXQ85_003116 [[Candida] haemuloni]